MIDKGNGVDDVPTAAGLNKSFPPRLADWLTGYADQEGHMGDTDTDTKSKNVKRARSFLGGADIPFAEADALWRALMRSNELALARMVLQRMRLEPNTVIGGVPGDKAIRDEQCRQEALLTSKDVEINPADRHDLAITLLDNRFDLKSPKLDGDAETLGIAGGICKRKWNDLGQFADLKRAVGFYERGATGDLGQDAYAQINAAFLEDVLAATGDDPLIRHGRAKVLRERIVKELGAVDSWWNAASRAEAYFGLGDYAAAIGELNRVKGQRVPWELQTTAQQLAHLAHLLHGPRPFDKAEIKDFFEALLPGANDAVRSVSVGKIGLALSGGGFRASFFHLGVMAFLAERNVLRNIDVLSCVSGGSIVGASYWLALRARLKDSSPMTHDGYLLLVRDLIRNFQDSVAGNLRRQVQPSIPQAIWGFLTGMKGVMDPEKTAPVLERLFYAPKWQGNSPIHMHDLVFTPADHDPVLTGSDSFNPSNHNWLRAHKVPALILNATTVNTGHAWQFTSTWMGEAPWSIYQAADSVRRLQWSNYNVAAGWKIELGRAVASSACVPGVFAPLQLDAKFEDKDIRVSLVDGGVFDNQGTVSLLASSCNVLLVSDACGQLMLEKAPPRGFLGLPKFAMRAMDTLMERVRLANFADLDARRRSSLLRGLMFLHMKSGLDADVERLSFSQDTYQLKRQRLSPSGVRKDFQQALAELRTDLDDFSPDESSALMACGYQMASYGFERDLKKFDGMWDPPPPTIPDWPFKAMLDEITSEEAATPRREELLAALSRGNKVRR
jgi:predicted acylesterase/phospholipase RssA